MKDVVEEKDREIQSKNTEIEDLRAIMRRRLEECQQRIRELIASLESNQKEMQMTGEERDHLSAQVEALLQEQKSIQGEMNGLRSAYDRLNREYSLQKEDLQRRTQEIRKSMQREQQSHLELRQVKEKQTLKVNALLTAIAAYLPKLSVMGWWVLTVAVGEVIEWIGKKI